MKKKNPRYLTYILLGVALCLLVTSVVLCDRLGSFTVSGDSPSVSIPLVPEDPNGSGDNEVENDNGAETQPETKPAETEKVHNPEFVPVDDQGPWTEEREIEIFKVYHTGADGGIAVSTSDGKLIAPGTEHIYNFRLENKGDVGLDYEMTMEAVISDNISRLPVEVKVYDHKGRYITGTETSYSNVITLNEVVDGDSLAVNHYAGYTLVWQWPFESGNDEYDTMLGNLSVEETVSLSISIKTKAVINERATGGIPQTGDYSVATYATVFSIMIIAFILLILAIYNKIKNQIEEE